MTKLCGIYLLTHVETGQKYVGQSRDITNRIKYHSYGYGKHKISHYIKKHGFKSFSWIVIELCSVENLNIREAYWIAHFNCISPNGLNLTTGGQQAQVVSEETRAKMAAASTGRKQTEHTKKVLKACNTGRAFTPEHLENLSRSHIGQKPTAETIELRRIANTGRKHTEESKLKMRKPRSCARSAEHAAKVALANTGRKHSEETKEKMRTTKAANKLLRQSATATT